MITDKDIVAGFDECAAAVKALIAKARADAIEEAALLIIKYSEMIWPHAESVAAEIRALGKLY